MALKVFTERIAGLVWDSFYWPVLIIITIGQILSIALIFIIFIILLGFTYLFFGVKICLIYLLRYIRTLRLKRGEG